MMTTSTSVGRRRLFARRALLTLSTALCTGLAVPAFADSPHPNLDSNGVDLTTGEFSLQLPVASVGAGTAELALVVYSKEYDNWTGYSSRQTSTVAGNFITIDLGPGYDTFQSTDGYATSIRGTGATLSFSGNQVIYKTLDGTTLVFGDPVGSGSGLCDTSTAANCTRLPISMTRRNGMAVTFDWTIHELCLTRTDPDGLPMPDEDPVCTYSWRLGGVSNSAGYSITYGYATSSVPANQHPGAAWFQRTSANLTGGSSTRTVTYAYPSANVFSVTTPGGKAWQITNSGSLIVGVRRPSALADTTTVIYSGAVPTSVTRDGVTTNYNYVVSGNTATMVVTDAQSHQTTMVSDLVKFRPTSVTDALNHTTSFSYDSIGRPTEVAYPEGNKVQYGYDGRGNVTSTTLVAKSGSGLSNIATSASYPSTCVDTICNQPTTTTDARGQVTDYAYNGATGMLTSVTLPAASGGATRPQTRYSYTTVNGVEMVTGVSTCQTGSSSSCVGTADEAKATASYNGNLLPTSISRGTGVSVMATTAMTYDAVGNLLTVDGPLTGADDTTTMRWSADREQLGMISADPDGAGALKRRAVKTTYNPDGQPTVTEAGTVTGTSDGDWSAFVTLQQSTASYDGNARKTKDVTTAGGTTYGVIQYGYDTLGRLECSAVRMNSAAWTSLPSSACTLGTTGSVGPDRIAKATYDAVSRIAKQQSAYGTTEQADETTLTYSINGQVLTLTDAQTNTTTYEYDGFDRLAKTRYPVTTAGSGTSSTTDYEQLTYDVASAVTNRRLRDGNSIGYAYDNIGRMTAKDLPGSELDVSYAYDLLSRPVSAATSAQTLTFGYDALGRLLTQGGPLGTVTSDYDAAGRRIKLAWPDGLYVNYDHMVTGETSALRQNNASSGPDVLATFSYDDLGQRTALTRGNGTVTSYDHDPVSRLSSLAQDLSGTSADLTLGFGYTPSSQIASATRSNDAYAGTAATNRNDASGINGLNQVTSVGAGSVGYDARGNLTSMGGGSYAYSSENLLLSGPSGAALAYDPLLRLYQESGTGVAATRMLYDGQALIGEYDAGGARTKRYVHGPGTGEPLVEYDASGTRTWLHADERGSIIARSDASGTAGTLNSYDEYGVPASGNVGRFGYTGQAWLPSVGLSYYKARMYAPAFGRFLQTDPIGYADGMNWYNYVGGDPVNLTDPSGLQDAEMEDINVWGRKLREQEFTKLTTGARTPGFQPNYDFFADPNETPQNDDIVVTYVRNDPQHHRYEFTNFICSSAQYGCSPERVFEGLLLNAAPGQNGPAFTGNIVSVPLAGRIQQVVNSNAMSVTNLTLPGHMFAPGYVTRSVISFGNSLYINTIGEGVGGNRGFNMLTAQPAFTFLDQRIKLYTVGGF